MLLVDILLANAIDILAANAIGILLADAMSHSVSLQDFKADLTGYLFLRGRNEEAGAVVNSLIAHPSSVSHMLSLLVYAEIAAAYNKVRGLVLGYTFVSL